MGDQNLRVWPVDGDEYGDVVEYPRSAKYRKEPHFPGATGDKQHDLVVFLRDDSAEDGENVLGRHSLADVLVAYAGQPTPAVVLDSEDGRRTTVAAGTKPSPKTKVGAGTPDKK